MATKERRKHCDPVCLQHDKEMRLVLLLGVGYIFVVLAGGVSLVSLVWWSLMHDMKEIAVVIGFAAAYFGLADKAASILSPSPLSNTGTPRRNTDSGPMEVTTAPGDSVAVTEVANQAETEATEPEPKEND